MTVNSFAEKCSRKTADMIRWREQLMWTYPIVSNQITAADLWLSLQPHLPFRTVCEILYRTVYAQALLYEHAHFTDKEECLSAVAVSTMSGKSFAEALDRAIQRSQSPHVIDAPPALAAPTTIEHSPDEMKGPLARLDRRFG